MRKFLPLNYQHPNSKKKKEPAQTIIMKPEALQETVNNEMVAYFDKIQWSYLVDEVAESESTSKEIFMNDLKLSMDKTTSDEVREAAESRIKTAVHQHGVWIGSGDLLTMKMFYVAKSLRYRYFFTYHQIFQYNIFIFPRL